MKETDGKYDPREGRKFDSNKPRWSLFPNGTLTEVLAVLEYGAQKYAPDNWKYVDDAQRRYYDAAMRHIEAYHSGEQSDPETGLSHLSHAMCCLLFLLWFEKNPKQELKFPVVMETEVEPVPFSSFGINQMWKDKYGNPVFVDKSVFSNWPKEQKEKVVLR